MGKILLYKRANQKRRKHIRFRLDLVTNNFDDQVSSWFNIISCPLAYFT